MLGLTCFKMRIALQNITFVTMRLNEMEPTKKSIQWIAVENSMLSSNRFSLLAPIIKTENI